MRAALLALPLAFILLAASVVPKQDADLQQVVQGQQLFETVCSGCHTLEPPPDSAPPMTHVVRHLKAELDTEEAFAEHVRTYVPAPDAGRSLLPAMAVEKFGLMGAIPLAEEALADVAAYLWTLSDAGETGEMGRHGAMGDGEGMRHRGGADAMEGMEGGEGMSCPMHEGEGGGMRRGGKGPAMGGGMQHGNGAAMGGCMKGRGGMKGMGGEGMSCPCHSAPDAPADSATTEPGAGPSGG